jgi:hypothetical protein
MYIMFNLMLSINSNCCTGQKGFNFRVTVNAFMTIWCNEAGSMWRITGLYGALSKTMKS